MQVYHPHPFDPKNKPTILRRWVEERITKCPVVGTEDYNFRYLAEYVEYTYINKKGKKVHVPELALWYKDLPRGIK